MGTSEEIRSEQQQRQRLHAQYPVDAQHLQAQHAQQQQRGFSSPSAFPPFAPSPPVSSSSSWPHEKLSESDVAHASQAMDVDPVQDNQLNERKSPSPTHYDGGASVFHFGESNNNQQQQQQPQATYADFVATPITRFLTKQTFGFIPRPSFPSPSDGVPPRSAPASPLQTSKIPSLRLPSLSAGGSLPQSPLSSPSQGSFSTPVGDALSQLFNSASLGNNSNPGTPTSIPVRSSTVTLPPLKRACVSPTTTLPPLSQRISFDDICKPFRYQRSMSCPSDAMARGVAEAAAAEQNEMESEAYAAPPFVLQRADVPKARVERSNSVDASAVLAMREAHHRALHGGEPSSRESSMDFHGWLDRSNADRHPLASLAESAYAMQRLSTNQESPRSLASANVSGDDESMNPFDVSDSSDLRREKKLCAFPQCSSNAVTRGLCISHGGGRRCQRKGCTRGAQSKGLCVAHGGGRICKAKGCSNIQRSMGLCIRHGGGKRCSVPGCQKGVVRQDLCTAHGGKRKCKVEDCNKHVKKKGLCRSHANSVLGASAVSSPRGAMSPEYSS